MYNNGKKKLPLIGIGLFVYNDEKYLKRLFESIVNQDYPNFILYISDNCSTDNTSNICNEYTNKYSNIKYNRNKKTVGAPTNAKYLIEMAKEDCPDFFMLTKAAAELSENLLTDCFYSLRNNSNAVLAFPTPVWIDEEGNYLKNRPIGYYDTRGFDLVTRVVFALWGNMHHILGLYRYEYLSKIKIEKEIIGHDYLVLLNLALSGAFVHAPNAFYYRVYKYKNENMKKRMKRYKNHIFIGMGKMERILPFSGFIIHSVLTVIMAKCSLSQKFLVLSVLLLNMPIKFIVQITKK